MWLSRRINEEFRDVKLADLRILATLGVGGFGRVELVQIAGDPTRSFALKQMKKSQVLTYLFTSLLTHSLTHSLTPWSTVLLEKLTGLQLIKKFPAFYGTRRFITAFTSVCHLSLFWASLIQSIPLHTTSGRSILIFSSHLCLVLPSGFFPSGFPTKTLYAPLSSPIRATCPAHLMNYQCLSVVLLPDPCKRNGLVCNVCNVAMMMYSFGRLARKSVCPPSTASSSSSDTSQPHLSACVLLFTLVCGPAWITDQSNRILALKTKLPVFTDMSHISIPARYELCIIIVLLYTRSATQVHYLGFWCLQLGLKPVNPLAPELFFFNFSTSCI